MAGVLKQGFYLARNYFTFDGWVSGENFLQRVWFGDARCDVLGEKDDRRIGLQTRQKFNTFRRETRDINCSYRFISK